MKPDATEAIEVHVGKPLYGGNWQAALEEVETSGVHLPFVAEGELVRIATASAVQANDPPQLEVLEILRASPDRTEPRCRHFAECGGCQYQHLQAESQLRVKASILTSLLTEARIAIPAAGLQLHAAKPYGYRNRMRLRVHDGAVGYSRRGSHGFLPVTECPIVSPLLWRAAQALLHITAAGKARWPEGTSEAEFFATDDDAGLQMSLHLKATVPMMNRDAPATFRSMCTALQAKLPEMRGAGLLVQAETAAKTSGTSKRVQERQRVEVARWGDAAMTYHMGGRNYRVSRGAFFQVNRFLTARMVELTVGHRGGDLALDLFAGSGLFSLALTERFSRVIAVEAGEPAATDLTGLMREAGPQHRAERATTLEFLRRWPRDFHPLQSTQQRPNLVVADPPRAGLGPEVVRELLRIAPRELVYVSCDPVTFARDARALVKSGYAATELHLLDLFPQSFHMETVAVFHPR